MSLVLNKLSISSLIFGIALNALQSILSRVGLNIRSVSITSASPSQLFWASILVGGASAINGAYPVYFLPPCRGEVTINFFSSMRCELDQLFLK